MANLDGLRKPSGLYDHPRSDAFMKKQLSLFLPDSIVKQQVRYLVWYWVGSWLSTRFILVLPHGIDPWSHDYQSCALPLSYRRMVDSLGLEPRTCGLKDRCSNLLS